MSDYFKTGKGFSIELIEYKLERRGTYEGLPLYESLGGRVTAIAIVDEPAIGVKTIGDNNEQTISGPVMIPNLPIYRTKGPNGSEKCYWYFSEKTIAELQRGYEGKIKIGH